MTAAPFSVRASVWLNNRTQHPIGVWVFLLGACMTLGYAPFGLWPVALLSLAGLWWMVRHASSAKQAMGAALVWGLGHYISALYWLPWAFFKDSGGSWLAAIGGGVPAVLVLALFSTLTYMIASYISYALLRRDRATAAGCAWVITIVVLEFLKGLHPMGFPWLPVGAIFASSLTLMQTASLGGVWLLSTLGLSLAVLTTSGHRRAYIAIATVIVLMAGYGTWRLHSIPMKTSGERVRVVQPNIQSAHKWDPQTRLSFLQDTLKTALDNNDGPAPRTVIMPETAVAFYLPEEDDVRTAIATRLAASLPADSGLITGSIRRGPNPGKPLPKFYNSFVAMDERGVLRGVYDKQLLVPFGEYIPLRDWLEKLPLPMPLRTLSQSRIDFTHGTRSPLLPTPAGEALGLICYEGIFPWHVARHAEGARYLANITNDGWFTGTIALYQHAALARLRAVETGLPLVRVANTGLTLVYDGLGRELLRLPINKAVRADIDLPPRLPATPLLNIINP